MRLICSDKTLSGLTKHIHQELLPTIDEDDDANITSAITSALPPSLVEKAIEEVLIRNNYGIDAALGVKLPAAVCVWRWETRSEHMAWLPKNSREKAETRHAERLQAKEDLKSLFDALPQEERDAIIDPKGANKLPSKELNKPIASTSSETMHEDVKCTPQSSKKQGKKKADEPENDNVSPYPQHSCICIDAPSSKAKRRPLALRKHRTPRRLRR